MAVAVSIGDWAAFGVPPASTAAKLVPIESVRYE
jgi:hypothetical protein